MPQGQGHRRYSLATSYHPYPTPQPHHSFPPRAVSGLPASTPSVQAFSAFPYQHPTPGYSPSAIWDPSWYHHPDATATLSPPFAGCDLDEAFVSSSRFVSSIGREGTYATSSPSPPTNSPSPPTYSPSDPQSPTSWSFSSASKHTCMPFISKLRGLLEDGSFVDAASWDSTGTFIVFATASPRWSVEILPVFFGHRNFPSFTRQLNVYGFSRVRQKDLVALIDTQSPNALPLVQYSAWTHPSFSRDDPRDSWEMRPRPSAASRSKKEQRKRSSGGKVKLELE